MKLKDFLYSEKSKNPHYFLIGNPIEHSVSPIMHNLALKHHGLEGQYHALSITGKDFETLTEHFRNPNFRGANVTIPHKENLIPYMDKMGKEATEINAVNTIIKSENQVIGQNTDAYGFIKPINELNIDLANKRVIIFGTGGATKALIYALNKKKVSDIVLVSRRPKKYDDDENNNIIRCGYDNWFIFAGEAALIINATPLGMHPNVNASPIENAQIEYMQGKICYDIVYNPRTTYFLKQAETAGGTPVGGLDMLIYQGAKSFKYWTGLDFPIDLIKEKLNEILPN